MSSLRLVPLLVCLAAPAAANPYDELIRVDVLPGWRTADGTQMAGLVFTLAPGWKTYWRAPGAAGIPPAFDWTGSTNLEAAHFHWPVPEVFHLNGMMSIGYSGQVVLPVELTPSDPDAPMKMSGNIDLGVCEEICVPVTLAFDAELPRGGERDPAITAALVDRPLSAEEAGVTAAQCDVAPAGDGLALTASIRMPPDGGDEVVVVEPGIPGVWVSEASSSWQDGWLVAEVEMIAVDGGAISLERSELRITVLGDTGAVDILGCPAG